MHYIVYIRYLWHKSNSCALCIAFMKFAEICYGTNRQVSTTIHVFVLIRQKLCRSNFRITQCISCTLNIQQHQLTITLFKWKMCKTFCFLAWSTFFIWNFSIIINIFLEAATYILFYGDIFSWNLYFPHEYVVVRKEIHWLGIFNFTELCLELLCKTLCQQMGLNCFLCVIL